MAGTQDDDMYLFSGGLDQTPGAFAGQDFDNFLAASPDDNDTMVAEFMNPNDLTIKREGTDRGQRLCNLPRSSRSSASSSSSSASARYLKRNTSTATSNASPRQPRTNQAWSSGINGLSMPAGEQYFDDTSMSGLDQDFEVSNQEMAATFDFDTAASTPSGFDAASMVSMKPNPTIQPYRRVATISNFSTARTATPRGNGNQAQFFLGSREASPLSAMLPSTTAPSPWTKNSPSSGLEETFNGITMNGDSPGNGTLSPTMQFNSGGFTFDTDFAGTPASFHKDITSPSTIHSGDGNPRLTIYPTSLKSRVETQIPIKMVLYPLPQGAKKLRLPTYTVSKPKFLAKPEVDRSPEILELSTSLVCTSAMQDPMRLERALARARGDDLSPYTRPSPASSNGSHNSSRDDDEKPLNGGEVKICSGCIQRERKRASRKKQKKPEEEEMFQKDEEKRVVVFNTSEIKDWVEVTKDNQPSADNMSIPPPGATQVELPMRIACYCRHQNEKMGFQVIFTIKDYRDRVVAQAMTNSIMITDDHKTHNAPAPAQNAHMSQMSAGPQLPGAGVFSTAGMEMATPSMNNRLFKQSFSTTDLHGLQHNFNPSFPMASTTNPFAIPGSMSAMSSGTMTPRILSRPASPSGPSGPTTKRRKQSGSGKLPTGLTMTRLDTSQNQSLGSATMPSTAVSSPYAPNMASFMSSADRPFQMLTRPQPFSTSPPTPNGNDGGFPPSINRSFSMENIPRQAMISAPASRQPSRPNSPRPNSNRNSFGAADPSFGQAVNNSLMSQASRRPPPIIHKLVPAEGSVTGGTEVTLLGNGFYQGLEVMFGDTEATTTTFWGEKCLNCIAPPALQPGVVAVVFKHEHPQYGPMQQQSQTRPSVFTYIDDREIEVLRLALRTIGKQMQHPTDDPYSAAQQLIQQNQQQGMWPQQGGYNMGSHQRQGSGMNQMDLQRLEHDLLSTLRFVSGSPARSQLRLDVHGSSGLTLLHLASSMGMCTFVVALLSAGADPNSLDKSGHSPMHHAAMHGHERIIDQLRLAGADHRIRSVRKFVPADLATTLASHQATLRPYRHYRARSAGIAFARSHRRAISSQSLQSFWEQEHNEDEDAYDSSSEESADLADTGPLRMPFARPDSMTAASSRAISRRGSNQFNADGLSRASSHHEEQPGSPNALMQAWKQLLNVTHTQQQQLAEQIQHFQEAANRAMPHVPALPQENAIVRRMSLLFQQRPEAVTHNDKEVDISASPSSSAPPAYDELYPGRQDSDTDLALKKSSAIQAAADATMDLHYEQMTSASNNSRLSPQPQSSSAALTSTQRIEIMKDRKLFFFWIPLLAIVMALMLRSSSIMQVIPAVSNWLNGIHNREVMEVM